MMSKKPKHIEVHYLITESGPFKGKRFIHQDIESRGRDRDGRYHSVKRAIEVASKVRQAGFPAWIESVTASAD